MRFADQELHAECQRGLPMTCYVYSSKGIIAYTQIPLEALGIVIKRTRFTNREFDLYVILFGEKMVELPVDSVELVTE